MGSWQDRNESSQNRIGKLEALQKIICMTGRTAWQKKMVQQQQYGRTHGTLAGRNFGRKGLNFGRMKLLERPGNPVMFFPLQGIWFRGITIDFSFKIG